MNSYILKATAGGGSIRAFFIDSTNIVNEAQKIHNTSYTATAALGRALTAASMMGSMLKNESELITLSIRGDGPLKGIVATSDFTANVKGYVFNPGVDMPLKGNGKIDVSGSIMPGVLNVIKDTGIKEPYVGQVSLISGEIAEDITSYYANSEQVPTSVALGVLVDTDGSVKQAGGFIIQLMPFVETATIEKLEKNILALPSITSLLDGGISIEEILDTVIGEFGVSINERIEAGYFCNCSRKRVKKALASIGEIELNKIIDEDKSASLHCHFCGKDYHFSENELREIVHKLSKHKKTT
ncbi:MAG: Hsp33 family molecular chaperone HslO [Clostridiales bacterium]|jgi:molecular chaperone Hsp33|nr:Hsp33 family molecular chaperone HslO [Clostridiales bacterium]